MNRHASKELSYAVIIPAYNEEDSIAYVLDDMPELLKARVFVADNNSLDKTADVARAHGAHVFHEPRQGYGSACLKAISEARERVNPDVYLFIDADYSDDPKDLLALLEAMQKDNLDLVIGSRNLGRAEAGSLLPQARFGNWLATTLLHWRYQYRFTDLGPLRAIKAQALYEIKMQDPDFGWTMEMQVKALRKNLRVGEISAFYRKRIGVSKISGTIKGTFLAGYKILWTLFKYSGPREQALLSEVNPKS